MSARIRAQNCPSAARFAGRVSNGRTIYASTDVVNACGGEGDGVSTIQPQRSLLHNRRNPLQLNKGDCLSKMVMPDHHQSDVTTKIGINIFLLYQYSCFFINFARMGNCNLVITLRVLAFRFHDIPI